MLKDDRAPAVNNPTFMPDAMDEDFRPETLGEQIVMLSGWGHGVVAANPTQSVYHNVTIEDKKVIVIDKGYDFENGYCTVCIVDKHGNTMQNIRIFMEDEEGILFEPPTDDAALEFMSQLITNGQWSEPEKRQ